MNEVVFQRILWSTANNSYKFYIGDEDVGLSRYDVPMIAFKYIDVWGDIQIVNLRFVT